MKPDRPLPTVDRQCPKCGHDKAHGPEYRRGIKGDELLGEHLRYYCCVCRYMTLEPTKDQDTPARRQQLEQAYIDRQARPRPERALGEIRDRQIDAARRSDIGRRSTHWNRD